MRLIADEDLEAPIIARLRADGHDIVAISDLNPGADDLAVLAMATNSHLLLLTTDRDFGDYIFRDRFAAPAEGVVLTSPPKSNAVPPESRHYLRGVPEP